MLSRRQFTKSIMGISLASILPIPSTNILLSNKSDISVRNNRLTRFYMSPEALADIQNWAKRSDCDKLIELLKENNNG